MGKLLERGCEQRAVWRSHPRNKNVRAGIEALLILAVTTLHFTVVARRIGADELVPDTQLGAVVSNKVGRSRLLLEKRLVNSKPLSVWTHSARIPRRAYHLNNFFRKSAEE